MGQQQKINQWRKIEEKDLRERADKFSEELKRIGETYGLILVAKIGAYKPLFEIQEIKRRGFWMRRFGKKELEKRVEGYEKEVATLQVNYQLKLRPVIKEYGAILELYPINTADNQGGIIRK